MNLHWKLLATAAIIACPAMFASASLAMTMSEAVSRAMESNPEILEAIANREGVEFELEQARGLYRPRVDLQGSIGAEIRDNSTTRANNDDGHVFARKEASLVVRQLLFDGFGTRGEIENQASRVDSAASRIRERSEFIALAVIREYLEVMRVKRILAISKENIAYHQRILGDITRGSGDGAISVSDRQQAQERVYAAKARLEESVEELKAAEAAFIRLVGSPIGKTSVPVNLRNRIPGSLAAAIERARANHPSIKFAKADVDAAAAKVKSAQSKYYPKVSLEGRATAAEDVGGVRGFDGDLQGNVVVDWNLYNGGIDKANTQEQVRHVDESYQRLHRISREVEEGVRLSWDRHVQQARRLRELLREQATIEELKDSYLEQFKIGERSLLDLLDTQNTRYSVQLSVATADAAVKFGHFRILAASGDLLRTLGIPPSPLTQSNLRESFGVPPAPAPEDLPRVDPPFYE